MSEVTAHLSDQADTRTQHLRTLMCGACMGCADAIPGVSGGTVALILGIYERLVTALSRFDGGLIDYLRRGDWRAAAARVDLGFLVVLGAGVVGGIVVMLLLINRLLSDPFTRAITLAAFFGMILASAILIAGWIRPGTWRSGSACLVLGLVAAGVAWKLTTLQHGGAHAEQPPSYVWVFVCGCIAICAMILPGISGAMILLVLGLYEHLTEIPRNLLSGQEVGSSLATLVVFGTGCALSLVLFSKVLRWLLTTYHTYTMSVLCGFMIGALAKLWPFQRDLTPEIEKFKHKTFEMVWPEADARLAGVLVAVLASMALVFAVDRATRGRAKRRKAVD